MAKQEIYVGKLSIYRRGLNNLKQGLGIKQDPLSKVEKVAGFTTDTATTRPAPRPVAPVIAAAAPDTGSEPVRSTLRPSTNPRITVPDLHGTIPAQNRPPAERTLAEDRAESSAIVARAKQKAALESIMTSLPGNVRTDSILRIQDAYKSFNERRRDAQQKLHIKQNSIQVEIQRLQDRLGADPIPGEATTTRAERELVDRGQIEVFEAQLVSLEEAAQIEIDDIEQEARDFDRVEETQREAERLAEVTKLRDARLRSALIRYHELAELEKADIRGKSNELPFEDPDLLIQPKEITPKQLERLKRHDVSLFPKAKNHDIPVLSNQKKDEPLAKGKQAEFAIPILRGNQKVYVKFLPDPEDITRGKIVSNGDATLTEDIEFDFIRKQWTTPHQANLTMSDTNLDMTADLASFAARNDVKDIKNHDVRAIISAHIADVQVKNAEFMGGNITETEFTSFLTEKRIKILELAKSEHDRRKDRRDNNIRFAIQTALACVAGAFVGVRVFGGTSTA